MKENIKKFIDLEKNDGLSYFLTMAAQQHHDVYEVFYNFIKKVQPKRILEIGTALGGFTDFLKWVSNETQLDFEILSYDIYDRNWYKDLRNRGIDIRVENVFNDTYTSVKNEVVDFINQDGVTIVLCDGGYKIGEFNLLSKYIKSGDFIMAHDYAENEQIFKERINQKVWNWFEISFDNISEACQQNVLIEYDKNIFENVVWTCWTKK